MEPLGDTIVVSVHVIQLAEAMSLNTNTIHIYICVYTECIYIHTYLHMHMYIYMYRRVHILSLHPLSLYLMLVRLYSRISRCCHAAAAAKPQQGPAVVPDGVASDDSTATRSSVCFATQQHL